MGFHFLELCLWENPNFHDYKIHAPIKRVRRLDRLKRLRTLGHLICNHAIEIESRPNCVHNRGEKDNVEKLKIFTFNMNEKSV